MADKCASWAADMLRDSAVQEWMCSSLCTSELPTRMWSAAGLAASAASAVTAQDRLTAFIFELSLFSQLVPKPV